jgi:phosphoglucomutase
MPLSRFPLLATPKVARASVSRRLVHLAVNEHSAFEHAGATNIEQHLMGFPASVRQRREDRDALVALDHASISAWTAPALRHGKAVGLKNRYRLAFANDTDTDRHGIYTPSAGLMNPNHYLAAAISLSPSASAALAPACGDRQDGGHQQHD